MTTEEVPDRLCDVIEQSDMIRRVHVFLDDFTGFTPIQYRLMTPHSAVGTEGSDDAECGCCGESVSDRFQWSTFLPAEGYDFSAGADLP